MGRKKCCPVQREPLRLKGPHVNNHQRLAEPRRWGSGYRRYPGVGVREGFLAEVVVPYGGQ